MNFQKIIDFFSQDTLKVGNYIFIHARTPLRLMGVFLASAIVVAIYMVTTNIIANLSGS